MASTEAQVCNIALGRIGQREFIDNLAQNTAASRVCAVYYADTRDAVLASIPWAFAKRHATLGLLSGTTRSGWSYAYTLPADCVAPRSIYPGKRNPSSGERIPFAIEYDAAAGKILLTDQSDAELLYTARITQVGLFPPLFVDALAWRLAAEMALSLAVKPAVAQAMEPRAKAALLQAAAAEANQSQEDAVPDSEFIRIR